MSAGPGPLDGIRVVDVATMIAGPTAAQILGDFGADVVKVEHPRTPDALRSHGRSGNGDSFWWKQVSRNKRVVGIDLSDPEGAEAFLDLSNSADVVIEGFRPGTLERFGVGWDRLQAGNPELVLLRMTGFGQDGPYRSRPAFGTLIEAMSGFAHMTGAADGPPSLPPFGLADSIAGISGALGVMMALHARTRSGEGQVIDLAILEAMIATLGPMAGEHAALGVVGRRTGNRSENNAPRNTYLTADGRWVALSSSSLSVAQRLITLVGRPDLCEEEWFATGWGRAAHADLLDGIVASWVAERTLDEVMRVFGEEGIAGAPVYDIRQLVDDPQVVDRQVFLQVEDEEEGVVTMPNVLFRMSETPGSVRRSGASTGADTDVVMGELGWSRERLAALRHRGVVR